MIDPTLTSWLDAQREEGMQLAQQSDLLELHPLDSQRFIAEYKCRGLVRDVVGEVREHDRFAIGIYFSERYLREVHPGEILTWLGPAEIWHPNIRPPLVCLGPIAPNTPLTDLLHRCFELITWQNVTMHDGFNPLACAWARQYCERFPVDTRPIKWRSPTHAVDVREVQP